MEKLVEYKTRAIIGNIRNISDDCINRPRPRTQYLHFWRSIKKKLTETIHAAGPEAPEVLLGLKEVLDRFPKPTNTQSPEISRECMTVLQKNKLES